MKVIGYTHSGDFKAVLAEHGDTLDVADEKGFVHSIPTPKGWHKCHPPESNDFRDGTLAEGCWIEVESSRLIHYQQVAGQSGVYLVATDLTTGEELRNDIPWQLQV